MPQATKNYQPEINELKNQLAQLIADKNDSNYKQKLFTFEEIIPEEYKDAFAEYFVGFKKFLLKAKGKKVGIEVNLNGKVELKIYSDNELDLVGVESDFREFLGNVVNVFKTGKVNINFSSPELAQNGGYLMADNINKINSLIASVNFLHLELGNKDLLITDLTDKLESKTLEFEKVNNLMIEHTKPIVFLEGETDEKFFKLAATFFYGQFDEIRNVDWRWIGGYNDKNQAVFTGQNSLDKAFEMYSLNRNLAKGKIVFLYDWDTNKKFQNVDNKIFIACIDKLANSEIKGIENLFASTLFTDDFYSIREIDTGYGKTNTIREFNKVKFADYICKKNNPNDFKNFEFIFEKLNNILKN